MKEPKRITVKYIRIGKDGEHVAESMSFDYAPQYTLSINVKSAVGMVHVLRSVVSIGSVVLKY